MILMSLRQSLAEASKKAITEGPEEAL